ncbi:TetR/AcrR family transcriptional regulator [Sciscionella sediminilitoris]|uniref:TetR/AcrR family transcriptional regulator n=1 Tax=Sciscionella sediminilitoris TaxID=1445613 RepID=UPI0004DEEAEA|nr:TetR/AcrR family transcriptional regulator [Sciscionella sp. SE31]
MRSESESPGQKGRTFIEEARRRQIIEAAVEVIAEQGYLKASLAKIAERAGISKGVISYHFDGKDDLLHQLVIQLYIAGGEFMAPRIDAAEGAWPKLRAYLESNFEFIGQHRTYLRVFVDVIGNLRDQDGMLHFRDMQENADVLDPLVELLEEGQQTGEFAEFDVRMTAMFIRDTIDGLAGRVSRTEDFDMERYSRAAVEATARMVCR